jgi:hypothetical protein
MISGAPPFDPREYSAEARSRAAHAWQSLLGQEDRSRVGTERLVLDLVRFDAPRALIDATRAIAAEEARHADLCEHLVEALGFQPRRPVVVLPSLPADDRAFERAMVDILVSGFAVGETMSVGGFASVRARAREPIARWALDELVRDEVGHGAFGEEAGTWAMRGWKAAERRALWPKCVAAMEAFEHRIVPGGVRAERGEPSLEALGAAPAAVVGAGLIRAVSRWVLPRLARMGVLPESSPSTQS